MENYDVRKIGFYLGSFRADCLLWMCNFRAAISFSGPLLGEWRQSLLDGLEAKKVGKVLESKSSIGVHTLGEESTARLRL
jgi:hypothetical protein